MRQDQPKGELLTQNLKYLGEMINASAFVM